MLCRSNQRGARDKFWQRRSIWRLLLITDAYWDVHCERRAKPIVGQNLLNLSFFCVFWGRFLQLRHLVWWVGQSVPSPAAAHAWSAAGGGISREMLERWWFCRCNFIGLCVCVLTYALAGNIPMCEWAMLMIAWLLFHNSVRCCQRKDFEIILSSILKRAERCAGYAGFPCENIEEHSTAVLCLLEPSTRFNFLYLRDLQSADFICWSGDSHRRLKSWLNGYKCILVKWL
jgi:hypothetical protein